MLRDAAGILLQQQQKTKTKTKTTRQEKNAKMETRTGWLSCFVLALLGHGCLRLTFFFFELAILSHG